MGFIIYCGKYSICIWSFITKHKWTLYMLIQAPFPYRTREVIYKLMIYIFQVCEHQTLTLTNLCLKPDHSFYTCLLTTISLEIILIWDISQCRLIYWSTGTNVSEKLAASVLHCRWRPGSSKMVIPIHQCMQHQIFINTVVRTSNLVHYKCLKISASMTQYSAILLKNIYENKMSAILNKEMVS
jgi:hypothetical protein